MSDDTPTLEARFGLSAPPRSMFFQKAGIKPRTSAALNLTTPIPLATFSRARITVAIPPHSFPLRHDSAGLLLIIQDPRTPKAWPRWVRVGVENFRNTLQTCVTGNDTSSDVSFHGPVHAASRGAAPTRATFELQREDDPLGGSLWAYHLELDAQGLVVARHPLRELTWVFSAEQNTGQEAELRVGGFAFRPSLSDGRHAEESLEVAFSHFDLQADRVP